jgi:hypothetical protein
VLGPHFIRDAGLRQAHKFSEGRIRPALAARQRVLMPIVPSVGRPSWEYHDKSMLPPEAGMNVSAE